jgi:TolB-like protein
VFEEFYGWAKEHGDVLGTVGFLFAMLTVVLTNGKIILARMRGEAVPLQGITPGAINMPGAATTTSASTGISLVDAPLETPDYGDKIPIAILPPKELSPADDHFADGLADDLVADLQQACFATPELRTVAKLAEAGASNTKIARDLGVNHVLTSSVRRQDDKVRVTVQLIDPTGAVVWSDRFDRTGDDLMAIQESIARKVADGIAAELAPKALVRNPDTGKPYKSREEALVAIASPKSRLVALLLCIPPLGIFGIHRFYVGRPFTGILYLPTGGLFFFGWIIDTVLISLGMFADGKGRPVRIWKHDPLKNVK